MQPKKLLHSKSCDDDMNVPKVTLANGSLCTCMVYLIILYNNQIMKCYASIL